MARRRRVVSACFVVVALGTLSACASQPSNRQVVRDVIQSLRLPPAEEACMLERLENYTDAELDDIADENENWDPSGAGSTLAEASPGMHLFIADFEECTTAAAASEESTVTSLSTGSTEPTGSTDPSASTAPTETTAG